MKDTLLIEMQYCGSIAYFQKLLQYKEVVFEKEEYFEKASYRNRCVVVGPNGLQNLSVQIKNGRAKKQLYKNVKIAYEHRWHHIHWQTLTSNYRSSPYFEFYEDYFEPFFKTEYESLFEFNFELFKVLNKLLNLDIKYSLTKEFKKTPAENIDDFRSYFIPKNKSIEFNNKEYIQVFSSKIGFFPNLSILDLLFCEGPNAISFLK
ncbi:MAG: hypothetical protein ACI8ZX_000857 [Planctomycetota bacterium]|jgi:hypothetical protein